MEHFNPIGNHRDILQGWKKLGKRIGNRVSSIFDAFNDPRSIPIPQKKPDRDFVESFCKRQGIQGGILTRGDHDRLIESLRGYNFSEGVIKETRIELDAHDFWNTDLPTSSK